MIRVVVADDQEMVRTGFRIILDSAPDIDVVGEADDGHTAVETVARLRPDVIVMDVRMPTEDGISATRRIVRSGSAARILILTTFDLDEYVFEALRAGASGFLLKDAGAPELIGAVRTLAAGGGLLTPSITRRVIEDYARLPQPGTPPTVAIAGLTARETEVLRLIAEGRGNASIADHLVLSEATVKTHVARIFAKLAIRDRAQAVIVAYEAGLVRPGEH